MNVRRGAGEGTRARDVVRGKQTLLGGVKRAAGLKVSQCLLDLTADIAAKA